MYTVLLYLVGGQGGRPAGEKRGPRLVAACDAAVRKEEGLLFA